MANETEVQQNNCNGQEVQGQVKHLKGYRKKGLVSEKVLLECLSDMSLEDDLLNPGITLSSVEDDDDPDTPMEESPKAPTKGTLTKSLSLVVPSLNVGEEPRRPPL
ncbi:hypothetical protein GWK47_020684 [Chionoecetes opilio]|uniref:Uncharacterized protein n=1 Tax=Chionoecetes opilio TaxID=41210 RepID=A0A8J4XPH6_CHIOP|nr:hypothetical protein GWK47_020684 [Chionoecetes opilio]